MCDPVSAFNVYSGVQESRYQAKVARNNAAINRNLAADALERGAIAENIQRERTQQLKSRQRAKFGASGVDISSGSAARTIADTAMIGELDALTIRSNAQREAFGLEVGAQNLIEQSRLTRRRGASQAIGSILGGASQVAGLYAAGGGQGGQGGARA